MEWTLLKFILINKVAFSCECCSVPIPSSLKLNWKGQTSGYSFFFSKKCILTSAVFQQDKSYSYQLTQREKDFSMGPSAPTCIYIHTLS